MTSTPSTTSVNAIVVERNGGPDALTAKRVMLDAPADGQVLVCRAVAGVNFVD